MLTEPRRSRVLRAIVSTSAWGRAESSRSTATRGAVTRSDRPRRRSAAASVSIMVLIVPKTRTDT
ncbi:MULTISPECIES: hypothetical protein [Janibacter]|uniref:hypothetical protein n=1 Tax=Janibacter TaxID=53457 RepID=UPI00082B1A44|nr:hypothetical protein [Janibacter terrae]